MSLPIGPASPGERALVIDYRPRLLRELIIEAGNRLEGDRVGELRETELRIE